MRQLKFRAWTGARMEYDLLVGAFGYFYIHPGDEGAGLDPSDSASVNPMNTRLADDTAIMQFTGLHDRNGVEIYESDFLGGFYECCWVAWCANCGGWQLFYLHNGATCHACEGNIHWPDFIDAIDKIEVVGNLYENPELLEAQ